jgi:hypothetical protein
MKRPAYDEDQARKLTPLLQAIGREILDRESAMQALIQLNAWGMGDPRVLASELAIHRGELVRAHLELEHLGCSLAGRLPLTFRIRRVSDGGPRSFLWQDQDLLRY